MSEAANDPDEVVVYEHWSDDIDLAPERRVRMEVARKALMTADRDHVPQGDREDGPT
jgi:hypothetical protein